MLEEEITSVSATVEALSTTIASDYVTKEELANIDISGTGGGIGVTVKNGQIQFEEGGGSGGSSQGGYAPITYNLTLTPTDWVDNNQSVTATGVTLNNVVLVSPTPMDAEVYMQAGIFCSTQERDSLGFSCETIPTTPITVNVVVFAKNSGSGEGGIEYELPIATSETLGGVKVRDGDGLKIDEDGTISIDADSLPTPELSLPVASTTVLGAVQIGNGLNIDSNGIISSNIEIQTIKINPNSGWLTKGNSTQGTEYYSLDLTINGITSQNLVFFIPNASDVNWYNNANIRYTQQQENQITICCSEKPTTEVTIGAIIYNISIP